MKVKQRKWIIPLVVVLVLAALLVLVLAMTPEAEQQPEEETAPLWQEQFDLGLRFLSEGNYEEAILAFSAAIQIEPNLSQLYLGRGDAYVMGAKDLAEQEEYETADEYLIKAEEDYRKAQELDPENAELPGKLEELEELKETLFPQKTFFEEMGLEYGTLEPSLEDSQWGQVRTITWEGSTDATVWYGNESNPYIESVSGAHGVSAVVTEYPVADAAAQTDSLILEKTELTGETADVFRAFLETNPGYKILEAVFTVEIGPLSHEYYYITTNFDVGLADRYTGAIAQDFGECGTAALSYGGVNAQMLCCRDTSIMVEGDVAYFVIRQYAIVPADYDGLVCYTRKYNDEQSEGQKATPLWDVAAENGVNFFAISEE